MIDGVIGVIIWTDDLDRLVAFYRDTLGFTPHSVRPHFVAFRWGDIRLSLGKHARVSGEAKDPYRLMVNLGVDDIHQVYNTLIARGVRFLRPPERESWGGWVSTFFDPDGNILQLMQLPSP
jgi:predicted enzyme related to lactoylglutathione lyase